MEGDQLKQLVSAPPRVWPIWCGVAGTVLLGLFGQLFSPLERNVIWFMSGFFLASAIFATLVFAVLRSVQHRLDQAGGIGSTVSAEPGPSRLMRIERSLSEYPAVAGILASSVIPTFVAIIGGVFALVAALVA